MKKFVCFQLIFLFAGCDTFLDADLNKSQINTSRVFSNEVTAAAAVTAMYNSMGVLNSAFSGAPNSMNSLAGLCSGELSNYTQDSNLKAFELHQISSQNSVISALWDFMYNLIYQANAVVEGVHGSTTLPTVAAKQLEGEALFMRAFTYFYLVNLFGDVPLALDTDYRKNKSLSRRSKEDIYAQIENDLLSAQLMLSKSYVTENRVRPNNATATALLARLYLYRTQYANAEAQANSLLEDPTYRLTPKINIDKNFLIGSSETIWQLMPVAPYANTIEGYNFIITGTPDSHVITDAFIRHFEPGDFRLVHWISAYTNSLGTFYFPYKYKSKNKDVAAPVTECSVIFRLTEIYLIRAEARVQLGKLIGANSALSDLNVIRDRAGLPNSSVNNKEALLLAIENDRWSELFTEYGHRWLDLKRTNRALEVLGNGISQDDLLWPIPASEFTKNPNLGKQNPGY